MATKTYFDGDFKCNFCPECKGRGCIGQLPGMGGVNSSRNFILNCDAWDNFPADDSVPVLPENLGIAPVTGAVQNIGFSEERDFYINYFKAAQKAGISICVGDGAPDEKLELGTKAVGDLQAKAYFFLKPYPDEKLVQRIDFVRNRGLAIGIDIDAYNIVTMRNQAFLERKTAGQIENLRKYAKLPFMLKGIFTPEDVELCKQVRPEIIVVSNHGGRVNTLEGSSAEFLARYGKELKNYAGEIWVDGGIRKTRDVQAAINLGAKKCLVARSWISHLVTGGTDKMAGEITKLFSASVVSSHKAD